MEKFAEPEFRDAYIKLREEDLESTPVTFEIGPAEDPIKVSVICVLRREE